MWLAYLSAPFGLSFSVMCGFLLPLRAQELGAPLPLIGMMVGACALLPAIMSTVSGAISDRLGPRRLYAWCALLCSAGNLASAFSTDYWWLALSQVLAATMANAAWLASQAYLASVGGAAQRSSVLGKMTAVVNAGLVLSPMLIGLSAGQLGYQWSFLVMAMLALLWCGVGWLLPEIRLNRVAGGGPARTTTLGLLRLRGMQVLLMLSVVRVVSIGAWMAFYPLILIERGFAPGLAGTIIAAQAVVAMVTALTAGPLAARLGNVPAVALSLAITVLGLALSGPLAVPGFVYLAALLIGIGQGISLPLLVATVSEEAPIEQRGMALGLRMTVNQAGSAVAPVAVGAVGAALGLGVGFVLLAITCWGLIGVALWMRQTKG